MGLVVRIITLLIYPNNSSSQSHSCFPEFSQSFLLFHIPIHLQGHFYPLNSIAVWQLRLKTAAN